MRCVCIYTRTQVCCLHTTRYVRCFMCSLRNIYLQGIFNGNHGTYAVARCEYWCFFHSCRYSVFLFSGSVTISSSILLAKYGNISWSDATCEMKSTREWMNNLCCYSEIYTKRDEIIENHPKLFAQRINSKRCFCEMLIFISFLLKTIEKSAHGTWKFPNLKIERKKD